MNLELLIYLAKFSDKLRKGVLKKLATYSDYQVAAPPRYQDLPAL